MSDASFAAIDAGLADVLSLSEENARLRAMLAAAQAHAPAVKVLSPAEVDAANLATELATARAGQLQAERELQALRTSHPAVVAHAAEDKSSELDLLRSSLATLASELEAEKTRATEAEEQRREEESKVQTLRAKMEESRRALMRLQSESQRRASNDFASPMGPRRASTLDSVPRRRSSLGLPPQGLPIAVPVPVSGVGLGLAVESPSSNFANLSTSPSGKPSPLHRFAHRRGSASLSVNSDNREEEDRAAKLRDLRLGVTTTKVASRRGSLANGLPDFFGLGEFEFDADRKLSPGFSMGRHGSISEEMDPFERPPSAPLRLGGRNNSVAVFENWSRRSSTSSCGSYSFPPFATGSAAGDYSSQSSADGEERLLMQLEGLRIQLAESEEGRRASEHCVKVLKDFITTHPDGNISLPPLPTDSDSAEPPRRSSGSRWSIPRLSLGGSRSSSPAASTSPNLTTYTRRTSNNSSSSFSSTLPSATPNASSGAPIFGGFSFSALVSRSSTIVDGDTSPTMGGPTSKSGEFQSSFPSDASPQLQDAGEGADFSPARGSSSSTAPSLTSGSSSHSSRSTSPVENDEDDDEDLLDSHEPEIVLATAENFAFPATKGFLKESVRPMASGLGLGL
ncbi:hypothetical protein BCR35DRAFT_166736 [Leucosporidium creatinivorum]|uniref:Uncharacterized protein n=1 Tax=Leucosporidium creatinivorum TaxID=106004 RepID=A0A1Y2EGR7_9BASI|nr:hypothetical protein BCR35DRAFT_166736 [Leucosporidium creatinivorum]